MQATNGHYPSVVEQMPLFGGSPADVVLYLATVADDMPVWGSQPRYRDRLLREFYKKESMLSGTVFGTCARYASFKWNLEGPVRQVNIIHRILHNCEHGRGWIRLMIPVIKDMLTQDNGAFLEVIRTSDDPASPVIQLNHLDSGRCQRTGNWEIPVIYTSITGEMHQMKWYQVYDITEYPDPEERMRGYQECAVSRLLTDAQKMRDIAIYEREKVSGRNPSSVHFIGGIQQQRIESILKLAQNTEDQRGNVRYSVPPIIAALDQSARVTHEQVDLRSLPDGYDKEAQMRWYTIMLALAFGIDPQDIAPLHGNNLGSSQQSATLQQKARGKGPALFMTAVQHMMNFHGIIPKTVQFSFEEQDIMEDEQLTQLRWRRAQMYRLFAGAGQAPPILPSAIIRQMMRDSGDLKQEYLDAMGEADITPGQSLGENDLELQSGNNSTNKIIDPPADTVESNSRQPAATSSNSNGPTTG